MRIPVKRRPARASTAPSVHVSRLFRHLAIPTGRPTYMPGELLLTFTDLAGAAPPASDDRRVQALLQRAEALSDVSLRPLSASTLHSAVGSPLMLRVRIVEQENTAATREHLGHTISRIMRSLPSLQNDGVVLASVMPNWIIRSAGGGAAHTGPGTAPDPAPAADWGFAVPEGAAWAQGDATPEKQVIVAVLDTSPGWQGVEHAAKRTLFRDNALLQQIAQPGVITDWNEFTPPDDVPADLAASTSADHGLFVSGIVHSIAPHAAIHLLHILDDNGFGRTDLLIKALDYCRALRQLGHPVVVNLSLYLMTPRRDSVPPRDALADSWFDSLGRLLKVSPWTKGQPIEHLQDAVRERIEGVLNDGAVIVAAAGNDALVAKRHLTERAPADYHGVIGVVATDREGRIANYSNRGDASAMHLAVATYGGQGVLDGTSVVVPPGPDPRDGIVGLYTRSAVNTGDGPVPNMSGWVYWSGTSFATPIISGLAANILARDPSLTPVEVGQRIVALAAPEAETDPALGCPYVPVSQSE